MQILPIPQNDLQELREYLALEKKYAALENVYHNLVSTRVLEHAASAGVDSKENSIQFNLDRGTIYAVPNQKQEEVKKETVDPTKNEDSVANENTEGT